METFINTVKKIYKHIHIDHDQPRDEMSFNNMFDGWEGG